MDAIQIYTMAVSLIALLAQIIFGVLSTRRAVRETERQIAETRKQEKLHALNAEETYKREVRDWGRAVVRDMAYAQQLCKIDPEDFVTSDYDLERARVVGSLRGLLDKAKWLFPNLAIPSREDEGWSANPGRRLSALETILHAYHTLDTVRADEPEHRKTCVANIRKLRKQFVYEMRRAVNPAVRGEDIERIITEIDSEREDKKSKDASDARPVPAGNITPA